MRPVISRTRQRTLAAPTAWVAGQELQSGARTRVRVLPARPESGLRYALGRADRDTVVLESVPVPATLETATNRDRCICLQDGDTVITNVEHLNAVFVAWGIDNATVVLEKPGLWPKLFHRQALPLLADSTEGFIAAIEAAGVVTQPAPRRPRTVSAPFELTDAQRGDSVRVEPGPGLRVTYTGGYPHLGIPDATVTLDVEPVAFRDQVSRARTLMNQYAWLPSALVRFGARLFYPRYGLGTGISEQSMLIMERGRVRGPVRYGGVADEFVRHKIIDFLGTVALAGPLEGCHFTVVKSSHRHDLAFFRALSPHLCPVAEPVPVGV